MKPSTTLAIYNRLAGIANRALQSVTSQIRVAAANLWRDQYNPLRGLTMRRAVNLLEDEDRGAYADLQWTYRAIERQDETLGALIERRTSAINQLDWDIKLRDDIPQEKREIAARQARALRAAYEHLDNLTDAMEALAMASFRGYCHLEKVEDATGRVHRLELVPQWHWVREGIDGEWQLNLKSTIGVTRGEQVDLTRFIVREVDRPINRVALICHVRKGLSQKDWDAYVEEFGIPAVFIILPKDIPADQLEEYQAAADAVTSNSRGTLPGGSDVKTITSQKSGEPFEKHLDRQDKVLVLRGTGGLLTMLTAPGSGTLAGSAHMEAFEIIARAEAAKISEILQKQFDRGILDAVTPGEQRWAYFELAAKEEQDPGKIVEAVAKLEGAGLLVDTGWIREETGYPVERKPGNGSPDPAKDETAPGDGVAGALRGLAAGSEAGGRPNGAENGIPPANRVSGAKIANRENAPSGSPDPESRDWVDEAAETALQAALEGGGADALESALTDAAGRAVEVKKIKPKS